MGGDNIRMDLKVIGVNMSNWVNWLRIELIGESL